MPYSSPAQKLKDLAEKKRRREEGIEDEDGDGDGDQDNNDDEDDFSKRLPATAHANAANPYLTRTEEDIKAGYNTSTRIYGKSKKSYPSFRPHIDRPFTNEIAPAVEQLLANLTNVWTTMVYSAQALATKFDSNELYEKCLALDEEHCEMVENLTNYLNSKAYEEENESEDDNQNQQAGDGINHLPKPIMAFKPSTLSKDATPEEFSIWKDGYEAYFTASNVHNCSNKIQAVFLNTCLDPFLISNLKKRSGTEVPTFSRNTDVPGHMKMLEQYFISRYPLHLRRADLFAFKPAEKMKSSEYFAHVIQMMNDAQVLQTPVHDIMTSFLAHNCPSSQLRLELLRADFISLNTLVVKAQKFEQASLSHSDREEAHAAASSSRKRTPYQANKRNRNSPNAPSKGAGSGKPKTCFSCNSEKHERKDCPHKEKICEYCKIKGHIHQACKRKAQGIPPPNKDNKQKDRNQKTNMTNYDDPEEYYVNASSSTPTLLL